MPDYHDFDFEDITERAPDPKEVEVQRVLKEFFDEHDEEVFFSLLILFN